MALRSTSVGGVPENMVVLTGAPGKMKMKWASMITQDGQCHLMWHEMVLGRGGPT